MEFNSLDSILFEKIIFLLIKNISIESLTLNLFPRDVNQINLRKIFLNDTYYKNFINLCSKDDFLIDIIALKDFNSTAEYSMILKIKVVLG